MSCFTTRHHLLSTLALCAVCMSPQVLAEEQADEISVEPQALASALKEFSDKTGLQIAYVATLADNKSSPGTHGAATPADALDDLLNGTNLAHQFVNEETVAIGPAPILGTKEDQEPGKSQPASSQVLMAQNQTSAQQNQTSPSSNTSSEDDEQSPVALEEILVTGSRIRGAQSASPIVAITRQDIERGGFATVEEIVEKLPQNFGAGATLDTSSDVNRGNTSVGGLVGNVTGGTSVNLRGLGTSSTLILLNGRRLSASGESASFTDISGIPVTAIERVEVLTDGASAIYGSDAIGGVVNFILRDDYDGAETRLRYGGDSGGDMTETLFGQSFGKSWDDGNFLFSYEYFQQDNLANADRDFAASSDLTRFGGTDWRPVSQLFPGGNPATLFNPATFPTPYAVPAGQDGTNLTSADFAGLAGTTTFNNQRSAADLIPENERHSVFLHLTQNIGRVLLFGEARFATRENTLRIDQPLEFLTVPDTNAFFVDPSGTAQENVFVNYSPTADLGPVLADGESDAFGAVFGVKFDIGQSWNGEFVGNWSKEEEAQSARNLLDRAAMDVALAQSDPALAFNVFGDGSNTNQAVIDSIRKTRSDGVFYAENELWTASFNVDGEAFTIPGGKVQVASGIEFRNESLFSERRVSQPDGSVVPEARSDFDRDVTAIYAEIFFPLVGSDNGRPGLQRFEISLAARYEDYSDFGDSTNPKVGIVWSLTQSLTFRGTYGTSFKAPLLKDLAVNGPFDTFEYFPSIFVPPLPFPAIVLRGGNASLRPEEATTWTTGFQWDSESVKGLSLDVTYFNIDFEDRIDLPFDSFLDGLNDPRFASLLITDPTEIAALVPALVNSSQWEETAFGVFTPSADVLSGAVPIGGILDARTNNLAQSIVTGVEFQLSYDFETALGSFDLGLSANYLFDFERALLSTDPLVDEVDTLGRPVDLRARASATWSRDRWAVSGFVNYVDGYTDNQSDPARPIDSWTTVDLTVSYDTGDAGNKRFFRDTRLSLTAQNLFDEDPPFADTFGGLAYDGANANGLGRFVALQITKDW